MSPKQILKSIKIMLVVATLVGIGGLIFATSSSCVSQGQNGSTICKPLTDGTANEVKNGGLSVGSFIARSGSSITGPTYVSGNLTVLGNDFSAGKTKIESLAGTGTRKVCVDSNGKLNICGTPANGVCGSSNGQSLSVAPITGLCNVGSSSVLSGSNPWTWTCSGSNGGTRSGTCSTKAIPVNGVCGSANGKVYNVDCGDFFCSPSGAELCSVGTNSILNGDGWIDPFTWTCNGSNGGTNVNCATILSQ